MDAEWLKSQLKLNPARSKADLARALGLEPSAVSKMLSGARQIKAQEYVAMRRFFGLAVEGERALRPTAAAENAYVIEPLGSALREQGADSDADAWVMPAHLFASRTKAPPEKIRIFEVHGDAMAPDFMPGTHVLVDLSDTRPSPAGEFVVSDGHGHIIRQCEYVPHSVPPQIRLSALNRKYDPYTAAQDRAGVIGRVIAKLQWL